MRSLQQGGLDSPGGSTVLPWSHPESVRVRRSWALVPSVETACEHKQSRFSWSGALMNLWQQHATNPPASANKEQINNGNSQSGIFHCTSKLFVCKQGRLLVRSIKKGAVEKNAICWRLAKTDELALSERKCEQLSNPSLSWIPTASLASSNAEIKVKIKVNDSQMCCA